MVTREVSTCEEGRTIAAEGVAASHSLRQGGADNGTTATRIKGAVAVAAACADRRCTPSSGGDRASVRTGRESGAPGLGHRVH